tara:strand:+ start:1465 stop:1818 length:354 start_codon:yes stop_codon:yes gene_type:complete
MKFNNQSIINNLNDFKFDFKNYLAKKDSIIFKNCKNLEVIINSKINKIIFINCYDTKLSCLSFISGIDIEKCSGFKLDLLDRSDIKNLNCFKSSIIIKKRLNTKDFIIINEASQIKY